VQDVLECVDIGCVVVFLGQSLECAVADGVPALFVVVEGEGCVGEVLRVVAAAGADLVSVVPSDLPAEQVGGDDGQSVAGGFVHLERDAAGEAGGGDEHAVAVV